MEKSDYYDTDELNRMQKYVNDYEYSLDEIEALTIQLVKTIEDQELKDLIQSLMTYIVDNEGHKYLNYKRTLDDAEHFEDKEFTDNKGIWEDYQRDIIGGLK